MLLETETLHGKLRKLAPFIPSLPLTRNGKPYLNWQKGLALNEFIALICSQTKSSENNLENLQSRSNDASEQISLHEQYNQKSATHVQRNILAELMKRKL